MDEVGIQVGFYSKEDCLVPKYTNFHCDSQKIISVKR